MKHYFLAAVVFVVGLFSGCGYTTSSSLPSSLSTIYVEPFKNSVLYSNEDKRTLYFPLLEVKVRNKIIDQFIFNRHLKISKSEDADLVLKGELISYDKSPLRYTDDNDVLEYRVTVTVSMVIWDVKKNEEFFAEPSFSGESTYFVSGALAKTESAAVEDAVTDLARRIVERTIENW